MNDLKIGKLEFNIIKYHIIHLDVFELGQTSIERHNLSSSGESVLLLQDIRNEIPQFFFMEIQD